MNDYNEENMAALLREPPHFGPYPLSVKGPRLSFRRAAPDDAEFILSLRLDPAKNAHLSETPADIEAQRRYLSEPRDGYYFIIEHEGRPVGTIRLYDQRSTSVSWGSWILSDDAPSRAAVESTCMIYQVGLELGFTAFHFDVRQANTKVWKYHERWGAELTRETDLDRFYQISKGQVLQGLRRYGFPVEIAWGPQSHNL